MSRLPLTDLRAEHYRLTLFPTTAGVTPPNARVWWQTIVGVEPEEGTFKGGSGAFSGPLGERKLVLRVEPARVDWILSPTDQEDLEQALAQGDYPNIGAMPEALEAFSGIVERFLALPVLPDIARMAFGAVLLHGEPNRRTGYERLPNYVPIEVDPEWSDFLFQVNKPGVSHSGIDGLEINRLSKWTIGAYQLTRVQFTGGGILPQTSPHRVYLFRLELDINTPPTLPGPLPRERLIDVYRELVTYGRQIAADGVTA